MTRFVEKQVKSILNIHKYADSWFWDKYSVSAYQGCQFNCKCGRLGAGPGNYDPPAE